VTNPSDRPVVAVWSPLGDGTFEKAGQVGAYSSLTFTPTFRDAGSWSMAIPYDAAALALTPGRLVTIDWRGVRTTWLIDGLRFFQQPSPDGNDPGGPQVEVSGGGALGILGWCLCWPDATKAIEVQPIWRLRDPAPYIGAAEDILRKLIADNLRDRYGLNITMPTSHGRGTTIRVRPVFDNLLELAQGKAKVGGIGLDVNLVNTDPTHAQLTMRFWQPADVSASVRLSTAMRTISTWEQNDTAPRATKAFVGTGDTKSVRTTLDQDISASTTSVRVKSSKNFPTPDSSTPSFRVTIGSESLSVVSTGGTASTTLNGAITATDTTIHVTSSDSFPAAPFDAQIGTESIRVTAISGTTWTVTRGVGSDSAIAHSDGVSVTADLGKYWTVIRGYGSTTPQSHDEGDPVQLARTYTVVTTDASNTAASTWGGHREVYVDGPSTKDDNEIVDSGQASLSDGAETRVLTVESAEPAGMQAFTHYQVGDIATAEVATGATATDNISAIAVTFDAQSGGITVTPVFGEPSNVNSSLRIANLIRGLRRDIRRIERE